jgi:hypothetical protein
LYNTPGVPLFDLKKIGRSGSDPRMLFSWYSADLCTDAAFMDLPPEQRANPSMCSWPEGAEYLAQQKRRLPTSKYRRLHLNLPGAPEGAFFDQGKVLACIALGTGLVATMTATGRMTAWARMLAAERGREGTIRPPPDRGVAIGKVIRGARIRLIREAKERGDRAELRRLIAGAS